MSKLSLIGKCILASGLQKHAIYALAVKVYKATQKHRTDAFYLHEEFLITSSPAEFIYREVTQWHIYLRFLFTRIVWPVDEDI